MIGSGKPVECTDPRQLLVEGEDARHFFLALIRHLNLGEIQIQNFGGIKQIHGFLKGFMNLPGFSKVVSIGVVRDAEKDPESAFQSVRTALRNAGLPSPKKQEMFEGQPRTGVWILPNAFSSGMLETLCLESVQEDPAMVCVDQFFECLKSHKISEPENMDKAKAHAFLSSRKKPNLLVGQAAEKGYWNWNDSSFERAKTLLSTL